MISRDDINALIHSNKSMQIKIKRFEDIIERQQVRFSDAEKDKNKLSSVIKNLKSEVYDLAQANFPHAFTQEKMQYKDFNEIVSFLYRKITEMAEGMLKAEKKEKDYVKKDNESESSINQLKERLSILQKQIEEGKYIENEDFEEDVVEEEGLPISDDINPDDVLSEYKEGDSFLLNQFIRTMKNVDFKILETIGDGSTLFSEIAKVLSMSNNNTKRVLENNLLFKKIVKCKVFSSGGKGRPSKHYYLTELGEIIFKNKFNKDIQKTDKQKLSTHGSSHHGGLIADVGEILSNDGYSIEYEKPFILLDSSRVIPDIYAYDERNNGTMIIECERVKNPPTLKDKFNKYYQLFLEKQGGTNIIHFITPDKTQLNTLHQEIFKWVKSNKFGLKMLSANEFSSAKIIFKTSTLEEFKCNQEPRAFYYGPKNR